MKPELVSAVVLLLGHEQCPANGEALAVAGVECAIVMRDTWSLKGFTAEMYSPLGGDYGHKNVATLRKLYGVSARLMDALDLSQLSPWLQYRAQQATESYIRHSFAV